MFFYKWEIMLVYGMVEVLGNIIERGFKSDFIVLYFFICVWCMGINF